MIGFIAWVFAVAAVFFLFSGQPGAFVASLLAAGLVGAFEI